MEPKTEKQGKKIKTKINIAQNIHSSPGDSPCLWWWLFFCISCM